MQRRALIAGLGALAVLPRQGFADALKKPEIYMDFEGKALKGYDPVAYHLERRPVKGKPGITTEWKGATWFFASEANRTRFVAEPDRWAPQYGGYCAWAIARGRAAPINPTIFRIFDDKLYLNLNMKVHQEWLDNYQVMIAQANERWPAALVLAE